MSSYFIARHVHLCEIANQVIFLDLRRDKYLAISAEARNALARQVHGWREIPGDAPSLNCEGNPSNSEIIKCMLDAGVLTSDAREGKKGVPTLVDPVSSILVDDDFQPGVTPRIHHLLALALACSRSAIVLRTRSLERIVESVRRRKDRSLRGGYVPNLQRDRELVAIFNRLRPFLFTQREKCLFDSITLVEFLAFYRSFPTWVVGVCAAPFGAHTWVQCHGSLFNCSIELRRRFTPILAV